MKVLIRFSGIILLLLVLLKVDTKTIVQELSHIKFLIISPIFLLFLVLSYIKTKRWQVLLLNSRVNITGKNLFSIYIGSFLIGAITPGRIGEILKYKMLMGEELDNDLGFVLSVQDRIWDLSLTLLIGSFFLVYVLHDIVYCVFFLPGLLIFIYVSMYPESFMNYVGVLFSKIFPDN